MKNSRCYILQENPSIDFSLAEEYGQLYICLPMGYSLFNAREQALEHLTEALLDFRPSVDYIICSGDVALVLLVGAILGGLGVTEYRLLRYDRRDKDYQVIEASTKELIRKVNQNGKTKTTAVPESE